jgi:hypothetical protein
MLRSGIVARVASFVHRFRFVKSPVLCVRRAAQNRNRANVAASPALCSVLLLACMWVATMQLWKTGCDGALMRAPLTPSTLQAPESCFCGSFLADFGIAHSHQAFLPICGVCWLRRICSDDVENSTLDQIHILLLTCGPADPTTVLHVHIDPSYTLCGFDASKN